jgi:hypothetical protein
MDVQRLDSSAMNALNEPTMGVEVDVDETDAAIKEAMAALEDVSEDNISAGLGGVTMENAPVSSDPSSPVTVQSPLARSFTSRMPETGEAQGTELPPPFEQSSSGLRPPPPMTDDAEVSAPAFVPPSPYEPPAPYSDELIPDEARHAGGPSFALRLGAAAIGAVTGGFLLIIVLKIMGQLGTVLGN